MRYFLLILCLFSTLAMAQFQAGKHYKILPQAMTGATPTQITEFFSYGCPACAGLEPTLRPWRAAHAKQIHFSRIPVEFNRKAWTLYAKSYYIAAALGKEQAMASDLFAAIQQPGEAAVSQQVLSKVFVAHGISAEDYDNALHFSASIDAQLVQGRKTMQTLGIYAVPTLIVGGRYQTDVQMAGGPDKLLALLDYLLLQAKA